MDGGGGVESYQSSGVGAVNAKDSDGGLHLGGGGEGPDGRGAQGQNPLGGGGADGAEGLAREHGGRGEGGLEELVWGGVFEVVMFGWVDDEVVPRRQFWMFLPYGQTRSQASTTDYLSFFC